MIEMETNQISKLLHYIEKYYATLKYMKVIIIGIKKKDNSYDVIGVKAEFLPEATPESEIIFENMWRPMHKYLTIISISSMNCYSKIQ